MKNTFLVILFALGLLCPLRSDAQLGWQWGRGSTYWWYSKYATIVDLAGNVFVAGSGNKTMTVGSGELSVIKTDPLGNYQWNLTGKTIGAFSYKGVTATSMVLDNEGSLYILGVYPDSTCVIMGDTLRNPSKNSMYFLIKCSSVTGSIAWIKNIANASAQSSSTGAIGKIRTDGLGNLYVAGKFALKSITIGTTTLTNSDTSGYTGDIFIAKYNSSGTAIWAKSYGGNKDEYDDINYPLGFAVTKKGNIYISGRYQSSAFYMGATLFTNTFSNKQNSYLAKFDETGLVVWAKPYDRHVQINNIITDDAENVYLNGYIDTAYSVIFDGITVSCLHPGSVLYARYQSVGTAKWAKVSGYHGGGRGYGVSLDRCGNLWLSGVMGGSLLGDTISFDGQLVTASFSGDNAIFISKFDTLGNYKNAVCIPSGSGSLPNILSDVCVDNRGNFYIAGTYNGYKMYIGNDTLITTLGVPQLFIGKYKYETLMCPIKDELKETETPADIINIFPNPANYEYTIQCDCIFPANSKAELYNLTGKLIATYDLAGNKTTVSIDGLASGIYQCRIISRDGYVITKKLSVLR